MAGHSAYPWQPSYGSGLPEKIGEAEPSALAIQADVYAQILQEDAVATSPAPTVTVAPIFGGGETIGITYTDNSGVNRSFTFDLS